MELVKIRYPNNRISWSVLSNDITVDQLRNWIIHLEEINQSPNTIQAYARHMVRFGNYLEANAKTFKKICISDYDQFLQWLPYALSNPEFPGNVVSLNHQPKRLSPALKNQVHLAVKSFYRYLSGQPNFDFDSAEESTSYDSPERYKPFLEHINARRTTRTKDRYLHGDPGKAQRSVSKRLTPENVLTLIKACHLIRDAFLVTLLYNTGMRIGEALGLRHTDIDLKDGVIWVIPRADNENGARVKGMKTRAIPVMKYIVDMYEDYITSDEYLGAFESGTQYVFCNVQKSQIGKALSKSYGDNLKNYLKKRTGIEFTWHMFRHTHASEAIADGYSLLQVSDRLGHASPQTTVSFYKHLFSHEIRKCHLTGAKKLEERLREFSATHTSERGLKWL
jgi:site-specific recombinase XerD